MANRALAPTRGDDFMDLVMGGQMDNTAVADERGEIGRDSDWLGHHSCWRPKKDFAVPADKTHNSCRKQKFYLHCPASRSSNIECNSWQWAFEFFPRNDVRPRCDGPSLWSVERAANRLMASTESAGCSVRGEGDRFIGCVVRRVVDMGSLLETTRRRERGANVITQCRKTGRHREAAQDAGVAHERSDRAFPRFHAGKGPRVSRVLPWGSYVR